MNDKTEGARELFAALRLRTNHILRKGQGIANDCNRHPCL